MSLSPQSKDDLTTVCPLDCSVYYNYETPQDYVEGLYYLEGATVRAYADGFEYPDLTVVGGRVTLPVEATEVFVGLPFECSITTLPMPLASDKGAAHTNRQTGRSLVLRTLNSRGLEARISGTSDEFWEPLPERDGADAPSDIPARGVKDFEVPLSAHWEDGTRYDIRQARSMPAHILALFPEPDVSDR